MFMLEEFHKWNKKPEDEVKFGEYWDEVTDKEQSWETALRLAWQVVQMQSILAQMGTKIQQMESAISELNETKLNEAAAEKSYDAV